MDGHESFDVFSKSSLFKGLKKEEIQFLFSISKQVTVQKDSYLLHEGESADSLYIVIEGHFELLKSDPLSTQQYKIGVAGPGDTLGEMALLDHGPRSASAKATQNSSLQMISFSELHKTIEENPNFGNIFFHLSENMGQRLRSSNELTVRSLKKALNLSKIRQKMGVLLISLIMLLSGFMYVISFFTYLLKKAPSTGYVSLPITLILGCSFIFMLKQFKLSYREMGFTLVKWKQSLFEGFVLTLPLIFLFCAFLKWFLVRFVPYYEGRALFEPFALIQDPSNQTWSYWLGANLLYVFVSVPIQEVLCRGGLQGVLERVLTGKYRFIWAIIASNMIFGAVHVFFSPYTALAVFFSGCYMGVIYYRTHNLLGSCCAHAIVGVTSLSIFGIVGKIFN
jgi:CRP-like cAMP-binding protein